MRQFNVAYEGVRSLKDIEISKTIESPISREEITKNMRELKSKLKVTPWTFGYGILTPSKYNMSLGHGLINDFYFELIDRVSINELGISPSDFIGWAGKGFPSDFIRSVQPTDAEILTHFVEVLLVLKNIIIVNNSLLFHVSRSKQISVNLVRPKSCEFLLHYAIMQSEIDKTDSLKICIARLKVENAELRKKFAEIEARNAELKLPMVTMTDVWQHLTSRKYPLLIEQASSIHPEVKDLLNKVVGNYIKQKEHQKMKPITSDCETSLRQENEELCISKQVLEKKIKELLELQEQYKSREVAMTRSLEENDEKVTQLSDLVALFKSIIPDTKKTIALAEKSIDMLENKCQQLEDIISAKDRKIIALADKISSYTRYSDINIEPEIYSSTKERKLWVERCSESV
ncbi:hypothetical protein C1646_776479 [Rhizophagus diaphanus]|nr:hypothetical protein C1646_776479 [Rhizophagus diaphanus] [Rhizophagus sp. MUCL 43196]